MSNDWGRVDFLNTIGYKRAKISSLTAKWRKYPHYIPQHPATWVENFRGCRLPTVHLFVPFLWPKIYHFCDFNEGAFAKFIRGCDSLNLALLVDSLPFPYIVFMRRWPPKLQKFWLNPLGPLLSFPKWIIIIFSEHLFQMGLHNIRSVLGKFEKGWDGQRLVLGEAYKIGFLLDTCGT